jgi:hypothetical protein
VVPFSSVPFGTGGRRTDRKYYFHKVELSVISVAILPVFTGTKLTYPMLFFAKEKS